MQKHLLRDAQLGRSRQRYAATVLALVIGGGVVASGRFALHQEQRSVSVKPAALAPEGTPASVAPQTDFGKLPLYFVENRGQVDQQVAYYVHGRDTQVYFTSQGLTFVLNTPVEQPKPKSGIARVSRNPEEPPATNRYILKLDFVGGNPHVQPRGEEQTEAVISYFKGSQDQWQTSLKTYQKVVYPDLWPGIDLVYSGDSRRLKYTFVVRPGADPKQIQLAYRGATDLTLTDAGQLQIHTPEKLLTEDKPYTYQEINGNQLEVPSAYQLTQHVPRNTYSASRNMPHAPRTPEAAQYSFQVGAYDTSRPLVIDPVVFVYAGYIGGRGFDESSGSIAVDSAGNAYVTGSTASTQVTFPETVGPDLSYNGGSLDAFLAKVRADGTSLVYAGYIGGSDYDVGLAVAVDSAGNAYVTGSTASTQATFSVKVGPDLTHNGTNDAFVAKVRADGTGLVYAGYLGGNNYDEGWGIAVDRAGNAYVTGYTDSTQVTFPETVGPDLTHNGGTNDAFVAKVRADGTGLVYAGYIGESSYEEGYDIAVDSAGNAYVTGSTASTQATFSVKVGPDLTHNGGRDAFVAKVRADGTGLVYAGYLGGTGHEGSFGIAVDSAGNAYVTGYTFSTEATFPETVGPDLTHNGGRDAFVAKVRADGTGLVYAGYLGGSDYDTGHAVAVDRAGNAYVAGTTGSTEATFPETVGPDLSYNGGIYDAFVAKVRADGTGLVYAGYLGGSGNEGSFGIAVDSAGNAYVAGTTSSTQATFPETAGPDLTFNGGEGDAFVAKLGGLPLTGIGVYRTTTPSIGRWYLDANRDGLLNLCTIDKCLGPFGASTDIPVVGRWNGVGTQRIGVYRPGTRVWYLDLNGNGVWNGVPIDRQVVFGIAGDKPVAGDWTGTGVSRVGVFRPSNGMWYLDKNNNGVLEACTIDICQGPFGGGGDRPVVGDWLGNGKSKIGVYRASVNRWYIDYNGDGRWNSTPTDKLWAFGAATDQQVVGDWTGDGRAKIGVFRQSAGLWYLDANGNGVWNAGDLLRGPFGLATDKAVAGAW